MHFHRLNGWRLSPVLAAAALLTPSATAQICTGPMGLLFGQTYQVDSQSMLDDLAEKCTTINGSVMIDANYTKSFYLPKVRNITGAFMWDIWDYDLTAPEVTSINLPDLEYLGGESYLVRLTTLKNVSMPKLKTLARDLEIDYAHEVDFRSLETARGLRFNGNLSSLRLDSLREVNKSLRVCNKDRCDKNISAPNTLHISIPSLQSAASMILTGNLSSLNVPNLTKIAGIHDSSFGDSLKFSTQGGPPFNLSFPRLNYLRGNIDFGGDIESLSMPNLRNISQSVVLVTATSPLAINLPFTDAYNVIINGNISSVKFPNIKHLNGVFQLNSSLPLDCPDISTKISNATNIEFDTGLVSCHSSADPDPNEHSKGLRKGAKIAIGVVVGVVGLAGLLGALCLFRKRKAKRQREQLAATESNVRLQEVPPTYKEAKEDGERDPVPGYTPRLSK